MHDGTPVQGPATADTVEGEDADQGCEGVGDVVEPRDPLAVGVADAGNTEDGGRVDGDTSDTDPFLHDLKPDDKLHTTAGVELAGADAEKHGDVGVVLGSCTLEFANVLDVLELGLGSPSILTGFTTKTSENVTSLLISTDFDKISGRFWEEPDRDGENHERDDLEGDRETPDEAVVTAAVTVVCTAEFEPVCNHDTEDVESKFNGDELTARSVFGGFGGPDWDDGVEDTGSKAIDKTGCHSVSHFVEHEN